jgi:hypothetical protein
VALNTIKPNQPRVKEKGETFCIKNEHMAKVRARRLPKVIFLVEQGALAKQQADMCRKYLPYKVKLITGEVQRNERQKSFSEWLEKFMLLANQKKEIFIVTHIIIPYTSILELKNKCYYSNGKKLL